MLNLIINNYIVKIDEIDRYKDVLQSNYDEHEQKFNYFKVKILWKENDLNEKRFSISCSISYMQTKPFKPIMEKMAIDIDTPLNKFLVIVNMNCVYKRISDEIIVIFIFNFRDFTILHYMKQPRSMFQRKMEKDFVDAYDVAARGYFSYCFLPICFRHLR